MRPIERKGNTIRVILDGSANGYENMARDEALFLLSANASGPVLRLYHFNPPCISIGRSQKYPGELDVEKCAEKGIEIVRRPTGGLSILHMNDFTYCAVLPASKGNSRFDLASFSLVSRGILCALSTLGIEAEVVFRKREYFRENQWCFQSMFGIDIEWKGNKICGSAQRAGKNAVLQHGTMIISRPDISLANLTIGDEIKSYRSPGGEGCFLTLEESGLSSCDYATISEAFIIGFSDAFEADVLIDSFQPDEILLTKELLVRKYMTKNWLKHGHI